VSAQSFVNWRIVTAHHYLETDMTISTPRAFHVAALALALGACASPGPAPTPAAPGPTAPAPSQPARDALTLNVSTSAAIPTPSNLADLVERVSPSVVNITTMHRATSDRAHPFEFFFPDGAPQMPRQRQGAGTGFLVDTTGYLITNSHVVSGAEEVTVRLRDDREFSAEVIGRDEKLDLALLRIRGAENVPAVVLGDSDALRVGEQVFAVGNPFGLGHTVTMGIVSAKARTIGAGPYDDFIQTDASINPGNSGGPLFNLRGEVVGINTAIRAGADGIGFAIPVEALKDVIHQLKDKGFVERGKLGLHFQPVTAELAKALGMDRPIGALVSEVMSTSAAAKAGVQSGDVIVGVNGTTIHRAEELPRRVARHAPGSTIQLQLVRNKQKLTVNAVLDKLEDEQPRAAPRPRPKPESSTSSLLGLELEDAPDGGVRVVSLNRAHEGLRSGDVIVEVNGTAVRTVEQLRAVLRKTPKANTALFKIRRGDRQRYVGVPLGR
jgi:serine protease Do